MNKFKIGTYIAGWNEGGIKKLRYNCLDFINYAFAVPTEDGDIRPFANPDFVHQVVKEAHEHGVTIVISVGGWSWQDVPLEATFEKATETPEKIERLAKAITAVVDEFDFDGADMDWEYPRIHTAAANEKLLELLSAAMKERGKLLTAAVFAGVSALDNGNDHLGNSVKDIVYGFTDRALELFDWINLMVYDGGNGALHSSYDFALRSGRMWRDEREVPADKLVLGVPFYGRPGGAYWKILAAHPDADQHDVKMMGDIEAHYNGIPTLQAKTRFAMEELGGVMSWEISEDAEEDDKSLLLAMAKEAGRA